MCNLSCCALSNKLVVQTKLLLHLRFLDCTISIEDKSDVSEMMCGLKMDLPVDGVQKFNIDRQDVWEDSVATFKNLKFNDKCRPYVRFLGEAGIDAGGLSREYGLILRKEIFSSNANLFEGQESRKLPVYNISGILSNLYYLAGKMLAYLIIHLDIGVPMLSPAFYYYLVFKDIEKASEYCSVEDVPEYEISNWINQVKIAR